MVRFREKILQELVKVYDKTQHSLMFFKKVTLKPLREMNFFLPVKAVFQTASVMLNGETLETFPLTSGIRQIYLY